MDLNYDTWSTIKFFDMNKVEYYINYLSFELYLSIWILFGMFISCIFLILSNHKILHRIGWIIFIPLCFFIAYTLTVLSFSFNWIEFKYIKLEKVYLLLDVIHKKHLITIPIRENCKVNPILLKLYPRFLLGILIDLVYYIKLLYLTANIVYIYVTTADFTFLPMIDKILIYFHINPAPFPYGYYKKSPYQMTLHSEYHNIKGDLFYSFRHQTYTDWSEESYFEILLNRIRYEISSIISPEVALKIRGDVVHVDWFMHSVLKGYINFIRSTTTGWWPEVGYERDVSQLNYGRLSWVGNVICFPFYHELLYSYCNKFNPSCSEIVRDCPPLLSLIAKLDNIFDPNIFKKENVTVGDIVNLSVFMFISILLALISQIVLYLLVIIVTVVIIRVLKIFDFFGWTPFKAYNPEDWDEYFLFNSLLASKILYIFVLIPYIFLDSFLIFIYILYHSFITFFYSWTIYIDAIHSLIFYMESISSWEKLEILLKLNEKSPLFITYTLIGFIISGALILITWFLHISQESKSFDRAAPYECGFEIFNDIKNTSIHVQWFIVANLFLIFELEILTMLPFFLAISEMSFISYVWFSIFFIILGIGFIYEWNKKSIDFV